VTSGRDVSGGGHLEEGGATAWALHMNQIFSAEKKKQIS
jgi:hypothetical protein